jgi:hypothetical protein
LSATDLIDHTTEFVRRTPVRVTPWLNAPSMTTSSAHSPTRSENAAFKGHAKSMACIFDRKALKADVEAKPLPSSKNLAASFT